MMWGNHKTIARRTPSTTTAQFGSGGKHKLGGLQIPGEQLVEAPDGMVGEAGEDESEPRLEIDVVR